MIANMDGSSASASSMDALDLHVSVIPDQRTSLASMTPLLAMKPKASVQNVNVWNQEEVFGNSCNSRPPFLRPGNYYKSTATSHDELQPLGIDNARSGPLPRRSHTKSRGGCYTCKKRRIKCPENHPVCTQCTRRGLKCEWPELYIGQAKEVAKKGPSISRQVELSAPIFTPQDFRLFYHFIRDAYPTKPIGNESVWTHEVVCISHNYDYLLHAMLALSASDIESASSQTSSELVQSAMFHRILAIKSLNRALSTGLHSLEEGNAMLATCYILVYQSALIDEGLSEYLTFIRGCVLVSLQMGCRGLKVLFHNLLRDDEIEMTRPYFQAMPAIDLKSVDAACASLEAIAPLYETEWEKTIHEHTLQIVRKFYLSSCDAYLAWLKGSIIFSCRISHAEFLILIDPSNLVGQLLLSHMVAVQTLIIAISLNERGSRKALQFLNGMLRWLDVLHANIEPKMRIYYEWPIKRAEELRERLQGETALAEV